MSSHLSEHRHIPKQLDGANAMTIWCAGTFSIISQSMTLNCFPRVRIVHTSSRVRGQIYIPEVNWCLMTIGVALILGFTLTQPDSAPVNTAELGNAFGARPFTSASFCIYTRTFRTLLTFLLAGCTARSTSQDQLVPHSHWRCFVHADSLKPSPCLLLLTQSAGSSALAGGTF